MILVLRFLLNFSFDWEDTSNSQNSVWAHFLKRNQSSSKIPREESYFQLSSLCLEMWSNMVFRIWYILSNRLQTKKKKLSFSIHVAFICSKLNGLAIITATTLPQIHRESSYMNAFWLSSAFSSCLQVLKNITNLFSLDQITTSEENKYNPFQSAERNSCRW